jgi:hypothetical protein
MALEAVLLLVLLGAALLPVVRLRRLGGLHALAALGLAAAVGSVPWRALQSRSAVFDRLAAASSPTEAPGGGYVSSATCQACHAEQHATWAASYHRTMTQAARPDTALGPFDGTDLALGARTLRLTTRQDALWAEVVAPDAGRGGETGVLPVTLMTGSHHMQFYWVPSGRGREVNLLPYGYLLEERRWVPRRAVFLTPPTDAWGSDEGRWNRNCIGCHTTHGQPRFGAGGQFDTRVAELGIACEACHGPAERHVQANHNPLRRYEHHLTGRPDPTIVHPGRLPARLASQVCGQCHGVHAFRDPAGFDDWLRGGYTYRPGDELEQTRLPFRVAAIAAQPSLAARVRADPHFVEDRFWSDGMVRVSGREYNGLIESPCYRGGELSCLTCHALHKGRDDPRPPADWANGQLKPEAQGDQACLACHAPLRDRIAEHTHHDAASTGSRCYNCHMPYTSYGLLKAIRSHQVSNPDVAATLRTGRPNACNQCHLDRPLGWTADYLRRWYGTPEPPLSEDQRRIAASVLWALQGDAGQRALAAWTMGWEPARDASGEGWLAPYLAELIMDPYDAVRFIAYRSLRRRRGFEAFAYDFVGPPAAREAARRRVLAAWEQTPPAAGDAVLVGPAGRIDRETRARLLRGRDDRRVWLRE